MTLSKPSARTSASQRDHLIDRSTLRGSAALLAVGFLSYVVIAWLAHPAIAPVRSR